MSDQDSRLSEAVKAITERFGPGALYRLGKSPSLTARLPTGFAILDEALGGGLPRGRLVEIGGTPTTGVVTLALKTVACAQMQQSTVLYLDLGQTFDPAYADRCGVLLDRLLLIEPRHRQQGLALLRDLVLSQAGSLLVLDLPAPPPAQGMNALSNTLDQMLIPLAHSNIIVLCLNARPRQQAAPQAAVRLWLERARWLYHQHDIHGYEAQVQIMKNKGGPAGQEVPVSFTYASLP